MKRNYSKLAISLIITFLISLCSFQAAYSENPTMYFFKAYDLIGYTDPVTGQPSSDLNMSEYVALKIIQGVVNRTQPTLFIDQNLNYFTDCDKKWKEYYEGQGYTFVTLDSMDAVYDTFKSCFNGVVTFDHTFNQVNGHWPELDMAAAVGILTDRIPILSSRVEEFQTKYGLSAASSLTLTDSFTDYPDASSSITGRLETLGWTTALEAYQWGYDNLLKYSNPHEFHNMCEENFDLAAQRKMFYTNLVSTEADQFNLLKTIYGYYDVRNASFPVWGWVQQEDVDVDAMAAYGGYIKTVGSTNLSFHNKIPSSQQSFAHNINYTASNTALDSSKYYITFFASENDSPKAITTLQHGAWLDSNRGNVPINWGFEASMVEEAPKLAEYYYSTATDNDYFFSGGATPLGFADYDEMPSDAKNDIKQRGSALMDKVDQSFLDLYSNYGAIGEYDSTAYGELAAALGVDGMSTILSSGDYQTWNDTLVFNRPYMYPARNTDFSDSFSNANNWTAVSGTWAVESGEYSQSSTSTTQRSVYASSSTHSYVNTQSSVKKISSAAGYAGMIFRKGSGSNYYWFYLKGGTKAGLMKVVNGVKTILGTEVDFAHSADTWYELKVVASGTSIKCYADNKLVIDLSDSTFSSGTLGFATSSSHAHFDDVKLVATTQAQQIIDYIKSKTVNISKEKPYFMSGYYGYIFSGEHEKNQHGSEPCAGEEMDVSPTILKEVQDTLNNSYPGQFKFVRLDELMSAEKIYLDSQAQTIHDDLNDFSRMYSHSSNLYFDSSNQAYFGGDSSRLVRSSNTEESFVYKIDSGISSFSVDTWYWPDESVTDFAFYTSPDNTDYTQLTPSKATVPGNWKKVTYSSSSLPSGTKYLKIVFKQNTSNYWNPQVGSVDIQASQSGTVTDDLDDYSKIYSRSANLYLDSSNPGYMGGDPSRLTRSSNSEEYVIYKAPVNDITGFSVSTWFWPDESATDFAFYTSPDNVTYTQVTTSKITESMVWTRITYDTHSLPAGTKYIKIVYKQNTVNAWNPQIGGVMYDYGN